jgi:glycosyltransferase involved in cell wall biosynthesis
MSVAVYVGKHEESTSIHLVGRQMSAALGATLCSTISQVHGFDTCVNLVAGEQQKLLIQERFGGPMRNLLYFAWNADEAETSDVDLASTVLLLRGKLDLLVANSEYTAEVLRGRMMGLFTYQVYRELLAKLRVVPWAVEDVPYEEQKDPREWLAPFNRVNLTQKRIDLHHEVVTKLAAALATTGDHLHHRFVLAGDIRASCDPKTSAAKDPARFSTYDVVPQEGRDRYAEYLREAACFLSTSAFESFGIYVLELLLAGAVGVFLDRRWLRLLLPTYPAALVASDKRGLLEACVALYRRYGYYREKVRQEVLPLIRERYSFGRFVEEMRGLL